MKNLVLGALCAALFSVPVVAQECVTIEAFTTEAKAGAADFMVLSGAVYDGEVTDASLLYIANNGVWLVAFKDGCYVAGPILMDKIVTAVAPVVPPVPEVGA